MSTTHFVWDELSDNVLMEVDEGGVTTAQYTNEPSQFGDLVSQRRSGTSNFYGFDGDRSTRQLTDANQNVTDTATFTGCGEVVAETGTTNNPFGYKGAVGYYTNQETGDQYVRARTYAPSNGRWLSKDPLGFVDGVNQYQAYFVPAGIDPSGLLWMKEESKAKYPCGGFKHEITWQLDKGEDVGIVMQRICFDQEVQSCQTGGEIEEENPKNKCSVVNDPINKMTCDTNCYFEVWRVGSEGKRKRRFVERPNDTFCHAGFKGETKGRIQIRGAAFFITSSWFGDRNPFDDGILKLGEGGVRNAGGLFSVCDDESERGKKARDFWDDAKIALADRRILNFRQVTREWDCCKDDCERIFRTDEFRVTFFPQERANGK